MLVAPSLFTLSTARSICLPTYLPTYLLRDTFTSTNPLQLRIPHQTRRITVYTPVIGTFGNIIMSASQTFTGDLRSDAKEFNRDKNNRAKWAHGQSFGPGRREEDGKPRPAKLNVFK